jgi:putative ABC transport system permease protein
MDTLLHDLRYSVRKLLKSPGFALVAVLTLALGIGANSAIFSVVHAVLLRPLPYEESDRLVRVYHLTDTGNRTVMSPANFRDVRQHSRTLEELSFYFAGNPTLTGVGDPAQLRGAMVGAHFFEVFRTKPLLGRTFLPEENEPGRTRVAVLGHAFWQQRFGSDAAVIGRTITLDGEPYEVVGVMPQEFGYPADRDVWTPLEYDAPFMSDESRSAWYLSAIGRLKPGTTEEQAVREIAAIAERLEQVYSDTNTGLGITAVSLYEVMVGDVRLALLVLLGAVGLVLLIACANVANLLLARAAARESELAVRAALGAGRGRLVRQLLTESVLLGLIGGALGLLLAVWGTGLLVALQPQGIPRLDDVRIDATVVGFTAGVALLSGIIFGLVPAVEVTRSGLVPSLREGGRGALSGRGSTRVRSTLVVAEMALAVVLLAGAGLLIKSFVRLQSVDPGFRPQGALSFSLSLPEAAYRDESVRSIFYERLLDRMEALPGVRTAAVVSDLPMSGGATFLTFEIEGREPARPGDEPGAQILRATPDYFRTLAIPVLRGRAFTDEDREGAPPVVVLNQEAVRRLFPDQDPIGQRIRLGLGDDTAEVSREVVGVVGNVRQLGLDEEPQGVVYVPQAQAPVGSMDVVLSTSVPPMSLAGVVKREVEALDPNLPVNDLQPLQEIVSESISEPRFYMLLLSIFAGVALSLAAIGIFGVMSYTVAQRTREIGIRMALGAHPRDVLRLVVGRSLALAGMGTALGLLAALAGARLLSGLLYGVGATDPLTFLAVAAILLGVAFVASYLPARAATRVDPNVALRYE